jgi:glutathione synthase/RimK-type ligase-like ATP-grasp enzyme
MDQSAPTILCLATYFKGEAFLEGAKALGANVILLTREKLAEEAWPWQAIDEHFFMPDLKTQPDITHAVSYLARTRPIDRIVPLDDYDVITAAALREHLRLPGLSEASAYHFRDKLAMRARARQMGVLVPEFVQTLNNEQIADFMRRVPPPWALKPRTEAGAMGIKKIHHPDEVWRWLDQVGDERSHFLLEEFVPGRVFHVDSIVADGQILLAAAHHYWRPPMNVAHEGGVFISRTLPETAVEHLHLLAMNADILAALGMEWGANHTEFIRADRDGRYYFLETAARVGGANIAEMVEASRGVNLWREWAALEVALARGESYTLPPLRDDYAGVMICLARQEWPDLSGYQDAEIVYRLHKKQHAGLVVASPNYERVEQLLGDYNGRFNHDFLAIAPPLDKAPE